MQKKASGLFEGMTGERVESRGYDGCVVLNGSILWGGGAGPTTKKTAEGKASALSAIEPIRIMQADGEVLSWWGQKKILLADYQEYAETPATRAEGLPSAGRKTSKKKQRAMVAGSIVG